MPPPILDAVTAALLHDDQLFVVQRHPGMEAFPGYHAFPGGKVEAEDTGELPDHPLLAEHDTSRIRALDRELREEIGFDLLAAIDADHVREIHCLDQITTPAFVPRRFRTWFYRVELKYRPHFEIDASESIGGAWRPLGEWVRDFDRGNLLLAPPTRLAIEALYADRELRTLPPFPAAMGPLDALPWVEPMAGLRVLLVRSNTLPPARHTNAFWFGDEGHPRVLVDPSPADTGERDRLCERLDEWGVDRVFLTHHHADHREFADEIARRYAAPIALSADTEARIRRTAGAGFFAGLNVQKVAEGDVITRWQGEPVRALAVPGHDAGQLAPLPDSRAWCIVGDLIQGVGTVVIAPPEGHMRTYFETLRKVIDLDPGVILPSHGMAMGTTHYLQAALHHRQAREAQVLALHATGHDEDQMLARLYADIDPRLQPLARINIRGHLDKLREEGRLD